MKEHHRDAASVSQRAALTSPEYHRWAAVEADWKASRLLMLPGRRRELRELAKLHRILAKQPEAGRKG